MASFRPRLYKAPLKGAFFVLIGCSALLPHSALGQTCASDRVDGEATVAHVYDGDTLRLTDERDVRLIGIDAPEIRHDGRPSQPFARRAKEALEALAGPGVRLHLRYDRERADKYHRTLAHLFLEDGGSVQAVLLNRGLATALTVPPNLWNLDCYAATEARARGLRSGIWGLPRYQPVSAEELPNDASGFRILTGRVNRVGQSRKAIWLNLKGSVALRIPRTDLTYFTAFDPRRLKGRRVQARGWLHPRRGELRMTVRHPAALKVLD